jgi:hypothetical protein
MPLSLFHCDGPGEHAIAAAGSLNAMRCKVPTSKKLSQMTDEELQGLVAIAGILGNDPTDVLIELGRRKAKEIFIKARADRAANSKGAN